MRRHLLLLLAVGAALAAPAPAAADVDVRITAFGFEPADVVVQPGEAIHWTNDNLLGQSVTSDRGLFDSGTIPTGGGYSMAISVPGFHTYGSAGNAAFKGTIRVVATALPGEADDRAVDWIPDMQIPPATAAEVQTHPKFGVDASTTRITLGVSEAATVAEVNEALAAVDAQIFGGLPNLGIVLVRVPEAPAWAEGGDGTTSVEIEDLGRFTGLAAALERLRRSAAFEYAAMVTAVGPTALPRRAETAAEDMPHLWAWDAGGRANWGLKDARFPFAWNLRDAIARRKTPPIVTGVVDTGFVGHGDLASTLEVQSEVCPPAAPCIPTPNVGDAKDKNHGTHVAGTIGAAWDNNSGDPRRSKGVSGGNPFAKMVGVSIARAVEGGTGLHGGWLIDEIVQLFGAFVMEQGPALRVVNYSAHAAPIDNKTWGKYFKNRLCGPGPTDDALPTVAGGVKEACTPNNEDEWLREFSHLGRQARNVARNAAEANVIIVQAAGNYGGFPLGFCTPYGAPDCGWQPILATSSSEYAWASRHWDDPLPNPVIIVEAIGHDGKQGFFSSWGGDISAPGHQVGSTVNGGYGLLSGTSMATPHVSAAIGYLLAQDPDLSIEELKERLVEWGRRAPPKDPPLEHLFEWSAPDRFGLDDDGDRLVDYHLTPQAVQPAGFPIDLDACGSGQAGDRVASYTWSLNGETLTRRGCKLRYAFADEGEHAVTLTLKHESGAELTETRTVTVDDLLVAVLGDGLASGDGAPDGSGSAWHVNPKWQDARCHRSARSGPAQAARWLEATSVHSSVTFVHLACSGARIRGDLANGVPVPGADGQGGLLTPYDGIEPSGPALKAQLDDLPTLVGPRRVDALVVTAGADDVRFRELLAACVREDVDCRTSGRAADFRSRLAQLPSRFDELAASVATLGIPSTRVFLGEYPDFTRNADGEFDLGCVVGGGFTPAEAQWIATTALADLNAVVRAAASKHLWTSVALGDAFDRHGYCGAELFATGDAAAVAAFVAGSPVAAGLFHPNADGHAAYAEKLLGAFETKLGAPEIEPRKTMADGTPRLDAFASLLANGGAAKALSDLSDPSDDGNRRIIREPAGGTLVEKPDLRLALQPGAQSEPDEHVDMRDFRRFRDAWLGTCLAGGGDAACPEAGSIRLDGAENHPKRDLNLDRCVFRAGDPDQCRIGEGLFSRFDLNGDGSLSVEAAARVPLQTEGTPAPAWEDSVEMTDLEVLRSQWSPPTGNPEGWDAGDLDELLRSADLEVHAESLLAAGATEVELVVRSPGGGADLTPSRTVTWSDAWAVISVPVTPPMDVEVVARTSGGGASHETTVQVFGLKIGDDRRVDFVAGARIAADPPSLPADGAAPATIELELPPPPVSGASFAPASAALGIGPVGQGLAAASDGVGALPVEWTLTPSSGGATLVDAALNTDAQGKATAKLIAGHTRETYTVRASVDRGGGEVTVAEVKVRVASYTVKYTWQQEILEVSYEGSTDWPEDITEPDCETMEPWPGIEGFADPWRNCELDIDLRHVFTGLKFTGAGDELDEGWEPSGEILPVGRHGTISGGGERFKVTQRVTGGMRDEDGVVDPIPGLGRGVVDWFNDDPDDDKGAVGPLRSTKFWFLRSDQYDRYTDHELARVSAVETDEGVTLEGLQEVGDLTYVYRMPAGVLNNEKGSHVPLARHEVLLVEQTPGEHIWFGAPEGEGITFPVEDGEPAQFDSCGRVDREFVNPPGYTDPLNSSEISRTGWPDYEPGDQPLPVGTVRLRVRYSFAATIAYAGEEPEEPVLPACLASDNEPEADFEWEAGEEGEGRVFRFYDRSSDREDEIVKREWSHDAPLGIEGWFPATTEQRNPAFVFPDQGTVNVTLTVTDSSGDTATVTKPIELENLPPEASISDADGKAGAVTELVYRIADPGHVDKQQLQLTITSSNDDWETIEDTVTAGTRRAAQALPAGVYPLTLTVTDKDGATAEDTAVITVTEEGPAPVEPDTETYPTCDPEVVLDREERAFLDGLNALRAANGLSELEASPILTRAAEAHVEDMTVNGFLSSTGSDGSTPTDRAHDAGYPDDEQVTENLAEGRLGLAADVDFGWRSSVDGNNEMLIHPDFTVVGIARQQGSVWRWATSYGYHDDCAAPPEGPEGPPAPADPPAAAAARVTGSSAAESQAAAFSHAPTVAFSMSRAQPRQGTPVGFTNRSRDAGGTPIPATISPQPLVQLALGPDESRSHTFTSAASISIAATATDGAGSSASLTRSAEVRPYLPLSLEYLGAAQGIVGRWLHVKVQARNPSTGIPARGMPIAFTLGSISSTLTTDIGGIAEDTLDLPSGFAPGRYQLVVRFTGDDDFAARQLTVPVDIVVNTPPVADAGGPYVLADGATLLLDGSRSRDDDAGDQVAGWSWSFPDGGGASSDALPAPIPWGSLQTVLCGGTCETGRQYRVALDVVDTRGEHATAETTVTFTADFAVVLGGGAMTVVPGASNHFGVDVVGSASWTHPVTLGVEGLPPGVTATFSRNPVTPPDRSVLTLTAAQGTPTGGGTISVKGTSNGVVRETSGEVTVAFGLVPRCFGAYTGTVTNRVTGEPIDGIQVLYGYGVAFTDANGRYSLTEVPLGFNNFPLAYQLAAGPSLTDTRRIWVQSRTAEAVCNRVTQLDFQLLPKLTGRVRGLVVDRETRAPIAGATMDEAIASAPRFRSDANGQVEGDFELGGENTPQVYVLRAEAEEYWSQDKLIVVRADADATPTWELVRKCYGTIVGGVVYRTGTTIPVAGAAVSVQVGSGHQTFTNAQGEFRFDLRVPLGLDNAPRDYPVTVTPPPGSPQGSTGGTGSFSLTGCGEAVSKTLFVHIPVEHFTDVEGAITDEETGQPLAGVPVSISSLSGGSAQRTTDENGRYRVERLLLARDTNTAFVRVAATVPTHYEASAFRSVTAGGTATFDLKLLRIGHATATGAFTDAVSGAPLPGAVAQFPGGVGVADRDGRYDTRLNLGFRNAPVSGTVFAGKPGYWGVQRPVSYGADAVLQHDFALVPVCTTARIRGTVVNAVTQVPIQGAFIVAGSRFAVSDAAGRFELTELPLGQNNAPTPVQVSASAAGFITQTKQVTVFCGGTVTVDFGNQASSGTGAFFGTVTNLDTGQPLAGVLVGGEWGGTSTTAADGSYRLANVPLGPGDADRAWKLTAFAPGFKPMTVTATARSSLDVRADFSFTAAGNARPTALAQTRSLNEDSSAALTLAGADGDGDPLTYHVMRHPLHGSLSGTPPNLTYSPDFDYNGPDSFEFVTHDGQEASARATVGLVVQPVNDPPQPRNDEFTRPAGAAARISLADLLVNDADPDGDTLSVVTVTPTWEGTEAAIVGGDLVISAGRDSIGSARYRVQDGAFATGEADVVVRFVSVPVAPVCADATFTGPAGAPLAGQLACTDGNGDALTYSLVAAPAGGQLALQPNGSFTYTPPAGFAGTRTFTFRASDGGLDSAVATATLVLEATNAPPVALDSSVEVAEDGSVPVPLGATDPDGDALAFELVEQPVHGMLSGTPPALTYVPEADYHGPDGIRFRVSDGQAADEAEVTITVTPANDAPVALDDEASTDEGIAVDVPVLANDTDVDGDTLSVLSAGQPANGAAALLPDGSIRYTPAAGFHGLDTFSYVVADGAGGTDTAAVAVTVRQVNEAPVAHDDVLSVPEDGSAPLTLAAADADGDALTWEIVSPPEHGELSGTAPDLVYEPDADYHGPDSLTFRASDGEAVSDLGTVSITVTPVDDAPVASDADVTIAEDTPVDVPLEGSDIDGDALEAEVLEGPAHGTLDGARYLPAADYHGPDSIRFRVSAGGASDDAVVSITVTPVNDPPLAADDAAETDEGVPVEIGSEALLANDSDVDGDALAVSAVGAAAHGSVALVAGSVRYAPEAGFAGTDSFAYTAADGAGGSATATVRVTVRALNDAPVATGSSVSLPEDGSASVELVAADPDGDPLAFSILSGPAHGSLGGTGSALTYTPDADYNGSDSFMFRASDGTAESNIATVSIDVRPVNDAPSVSLVAPPSFVEGSAADLSAAALDVDGDPITFVWSADGGSLTAAGASARLAHPDGPASVRVTVTASDGTAGTSAARTVSVVNASPVVEAGSDVATQVGAGVTLAAAFTDPGADTHTVAVDWGDGSPDGAALDAAHAYERAGTYTVRVSVRDDDGATGDDDLRVTVTDAGADTTPPSCTIVAQGKTATGHGFIRFSVTDVGLGLARHELTYVRNATVTVEPYAIGALGPVAVTATAVNAAKSLGVQVDFYDLGGNKAICDPIVLVMARVDDQPADETFTGVPQAESKVTISNGDPGMRKVQLIVNRVKFKEVGLKANEVRKFDIASAMRPGTDNTITVRARGKKGATAVIVVADIP